jgi:glucosamine--fructose-6-phosphate aminotransferase (isomerizing)
MGRMCGIAGYVGKRESVPVAIEALKRLEYRGYDSAGIAITSGEGIEILKDAGKIRDLERNLAPLASYRGPIIAHTRWATHGVPNQPNAHPHTDCTGKIAVIHNGIIENYPELRDRLTQAGHNFTSDTDSETIPHLIEAELDRLRADGHLETPQTFERAVRDAVVKLQGAFALVILSAHAPETIFLVRKDSPLVVGLGDGENFVASDIPAVMSHTKDVFILEDGDFAVVTPDSVEVSDFEGQPIARNITKVTWDSDAAEKGGYDHFMLKEIHDQPRAVKETLMDRIRGAKVDLAETGIGAPELEGIRNVVLVACGTAYYSTVAGKYLMEHLTGLPTEIDIASEYRYRDPIIGPGTLMVAVSQSGETTDTIAALRLGKRAGARTLGITNIVGSTIAREADHALYMRAGLEVCVAATKTYGAQLTSMYLLSAYMAQELKARSKEELTRILRALHELPIAVQRALDLEPQMRELADELVDKEDFFFLGRGIDYATALEGALKLKEISYLHAESYPGGELKHGPLALITEEIPVFAVLTQPHIYEKMISNIREVKARGAMVIGLVPSDDTKADKVCDRIIRIPRTLPYFMPSPSIVPLQLFAYYLAKNLGREIDQPRNLAKSVTVE